MKLRQTCRGLSLLEVMIGILLFSLCMTLAAPAFSGMLGKVRLKSGLEALSYSLRIARTEAIRRNARVVLCTSSSGRACTAHGAWEDGWIVFQDANDNGVLDPGEDLFHSEASLPAGLLIKGNSPVRSYVAYTGFGRTNLTSGAFQAGTITICESSWRPGDAYEVVISSTGRVRSAKKKAHQCV